MQTASEHASTDAPRPKVAFAANAPTNMDATQNGPAPRRRRSRTRIDDAAQLVMDFDAPAPDDAPAVTEVPVALVPAPRAEGEAPGESFRRLRGRMRGAVLRSAELDPIDRMILAAIVDLLDPASFNGDSYATSPSSREAIATLAGCSAATVKRRINGDPRRRREPRGLLDRCDFLTRVRGRDSKRGFERESTYILLPAALGITTAESAGSQGPTTAGVGQFGRRGRQAAPIPAGLALVVAVAEQRRTDEHAARFDPSSSPYLPDALPPLTAAAGGETRQPLTKPMPGVPPSSTDACGADRPVCDPEHEQRRPRTIASQPEHRPMQAVACSMPRPSRSTIRTTTTPEVACGAVNDDGAAGTIEQESATRRSPHRPLVSHRLTLIFDSDPHREQQTLSAPQGREAARSQHGQPALAAALTTDSPYTQNAACEGATA